MKIKKSMAKFLLILSIAAFPQEIHANIYTESRIPKKAEKQIEKIVNAPSNLAGFANFKRKTKQERIKDNIAWYKKHGEVNNEYNKYGLDIKNYRNPNDYLTRREFDRMAIHHGNVNPNEYNDHLDDKILFDEIVRQYYPEASVDIYFEFKGQDIIPRENTLLKEYNNTLTALESLPDGKYFIKELMGFCGNNAILLTKENGDMQFQHVNKGKITLEDFWKITSKREFFIQKYVQNHSDIKALSPSALSTIRIVSTRFNEDVHILSSDLRVSCNEDSIVDNFAKNGAIIHVDEDTGQLDRYAFRKHKKVVDKHPLSGIKFENYQLPFWKESIELVKKLHKIFPEFSSIGWDVAITQSGPVVIEGNSHWDYTIPQTTVGGLKEKWERLHNM